ncbi:hypothetical protein [Herbaspirillum huttiense]|uniref:hypothetical protein n=1 Tax=Herbaspirillum huttiense TaxID=863372 RepID=UPI003F2E70BC
MSEFPLVNVEPGACGHAPGLHYKGRFLEVDAFQKLCRAIKTNQRPAITISLTKPPKSPP